MEISFEVSGPLTAHEKTLIEVHNTRGTVKLLGREYWVERYQIQDDPIPPMTDRGFFETTRKRKTSYHFTLRLVQRAT